MENEVRKEVRYGEDGEVDWDFYNVKPINLDSLTLIAIADEVLAKTKEFTRLQNSLNSIKFPSDLSSYKDGLESIIKSMEDCISSIELSVTLANIS